jgi:hypothetical protein
MPEEAASMRRQHLALALLFSVAAASGGEDRPVVNSVPLHTDLYGLHQLRPGQERRTRQGTGGQRRGAANPLRSLPDGEIAVTRSTVEGTGRQAAADPAK